MAAKSVNCTPNNPCPICGKPDWCNIVTYDNGQHSAYCQRQSGNKGDLCTGKNGIVYFCLKQTDTGFTVWQPKADRDAFMQSIKATHESLSKKTGAKKILSYKDNKKSAPKKVLALAGPNRLDEVYRAFLSLLILEDKHIYKLKKEWPDDIYNNLVDTWCIKSLPPEDYIRFSSNERLKNLSRKKIMEKLIAKVGEPKNVPGFYKKNSQWTFYKLAGIIFPVFDTKGRIIRLRIGDDYPTVSGTFEGKEGVFLYRRTDIGVGWYFIEKNDSGLVFDSATLVWQYGDKDSAITLNEKLHPNGKVVGKYKNFSSYKLSEDGKNVFEEGTQSNSMCSVYSKKNDNFSFIYVTEGEKKAMVANHFFKAPVVSLPGTATFMKLFEKEEGESDSIIDALIKKGAKAFILVYDNDKHENAVVLKKEEQAIETFKENGLDILVGDWNTKWGEKGLDDALLTGIMPHLTRVSL